MKGVFLAGRVPASLEQAAGLGSALRAKIGLDFVVEVHHTRNKIGIAAHMRRFFFGDAERQPDVFRGRNRKMGSRRLRLFGF